VQRVEALSLQQPTQAVAAAEKYLTQIIGDPASTLVQRNRHAYELAWLQRAAAFPLLSCSLRLNGGACVLLFLPGEVFIEYQVCSAIFSVATMPVVYAATLLTTRSIQTYPDTIS
jgi:hypothetical protein